MKAVEAAQAPVETTVVDLPWDEPAAASSLPAADTSVESDDEPPNADDSYFEADPDTLSYMDELIEAGPEAVEEVPDPQVQPATGLAAEWLTLCPAIGVSGMTGSIAANCTLVKREGDDWLLHLDPAQSALFNASQQRRLNDALDKHLGRTINLQIVICKPEQETPALAAARQRIERQRQAEEAIRTDPLIRQMIEQFGASIRPDSIEPL